MTGRLPRWAQVLLRLDRSIERIRSLEIAVVDRLLCLFLDPALRDGVTAAAYDKQSQYLPGSRIHDYGLFAWEREALTSGSFPAHGHLLLGGAGGGRELEALCRQGYTVTAFEPAPRLAAGARQVATRFPGATVVAASYQDLAAHARGRSTPFRGTLDVPIDGVILGLGSFTHVVEEADRLAVLAALHELAPGAPVLLSYNLRPRPGAGARPGRRTRRARSVLARLGIETSDVPTGLGFSGAFGFRYSLDEGEMERLAIRTGYAVASQADSEFPHAVLVPRPLTDAGATCADGAGHGQRVAG